MCFGQVCVVFGGPVSVVMEEGIPSGEDGVALRRLTLHISITFARRGGPSFPLRVFHADGTVRYDTKQESYWRSDEDGMGKAICWGQEVIDPAMAQPLSLRRSPLGEIN